MMLKISSAHLALLAAASAAAFGFVEAKEMIVLDDGLVIDVEIISPVFCRAHIRDPSDFFSKSACSCFMLCATDVVVFDCGQHSDDPCATVDCFGKCKNGLVFPDMIPTDVGTPAFEPAMAPATDAPIDPPVAALAPGPAPTATPVEAPIFSTSAPAPAPAAPVATPSAPVATPYKVWGPSTWTALETVDEDSGALTDRLSVMTLGFVCALLMLFHLKL